MPDANRQTPPPTPLPQTNATHQNPDELPIPAFISAFTQNGQHSSVFGEPFIKNVSEFTIMLEDRHEDLEKMITESVSLFPDEFSELESFDTDDDNVKMMKTLKKAFVALTPQDVFTNSRKRNTPKNKKFKHIRQKSKDYQSKADKTKKSKFYESKDSKYNQFLDEAQPHSSMFSFSVDHNINIPIIDRVSNFVTGGRFPGRAGDGNIPNVTTFTHHPESREPSANTALRAAQYASKSISPFFQWLLNNKITAFIIQFLDSMGDHGLYILIIGWMLITEAYYYKSKRYDRKLKEMGGKLKNEPPIDKGRTFFFYFGRMTVMLLTLHIFTKQLRSIFLAEHLATFQRALNTMTDMLDDVNTTNYENQMFENMEEDDILLDPEVLVAQNEDDPDEGFQDFFAEPHSGGTRERFESVVELIVLMTSTLTGYKTKAPFSNALMNFIRVTKVQKENFTDALMSVSTHVGNFFKYLFGENNFTRFFEVDAVTDENVNKLLLRIKQFLSDAHCGLEFLDPMRPVMFMELKKDVKEVLNIIDSRSYDHRILSQGLVQLEMRDIEMMGYEKALTGIRVETVGVLLTGKAECKKSVLMQRLIENIAYHLCPEEWKEDFIKNPYNFIYAWPNDKFHDTYSGKVLVSHHDDRYQKRDVAGAEESDALNTVKINNHMPFILPAAKVENKNKLAYRAMVDAVSTNLPLESFCTLQSVTHWQAVARRHHITVEVTISKKYLDDDGKVNIPEYYLETTNGEAINSTFVPDDFWNIRLLKFSMVSEKFEEVSPNITFEELIQIVLARYQEHVKHYYVNRFKNADTFSRLRDNVQASIIQPMHVTGSWYNPADPVLGNLNQQLGGVMNHTSPLDFAFPQSAYNPNYNYEDPDEIQMNPLRQDEQFLDANSSGGYSLDYIRAHLEGMGLDPTLLNTWKESSLQRLIDEPDFLRGFEIEYNTCLHLIGTKPSMMKYNEPNIGLIISQDKDLDKLKMEGAMLAHDMLISSHFIKKSWFMDGPTFRFYQWNEVRMIWDTLTDRSCFGGFVTQEYYSIFYNVFTNVRRNDLKSNFPKFLKDFFNSLLESDNPQQAISLLRIIKHKANFAHDIKMIMRTRHSRQQDAVTGKYDYFYYFKPAVIKDMIATLWSRINFKLRKLRRWCAENPILTTMATILGPWIASGLWHVFKKVYRYIKEWWYGEEDSSGALSHPPFPEPSVF